MTYAPVLVTPPAESVLTDAEVKAWFRLDSDDELAIRVMLLDAATKRLDGYTGQLGRALVTQSWRQDFDGFLKTLRLPMPASSITSVKVRAADGTLSTVASGNYALKTDEVGSYVRFDDDYVYPTDLAETQALLIEFVAGFGAASAVPADIKVHILALAGWWFANRESFGEVPDHLARGLSHYRRVGT